ncbi:MAG: hypothetical protein IPP72_18740 [Chitinophagaceae bacterium]|nr:hypothetical protein [Chitinophagaceae bacterium]
MKRTILYIVMFTYAASIFKPVMPFIADVLAHTFIKGKHLATIHVENGKSHVHWEIINASKKDQANQQEDGLKKGISIDDHTVADENDKPVLLKQLCYNLFPISIKIPFCNPGNHYPPPRHS